MQQYAVDTMRIQMDSSWKEVLAKEFEKPYFATIKRHYLESIQKGKVIYPPARQVFHAFVLTPFMDVRVVILGQDPYHRVGQAMGLAFSVPKGIEIPPSLRTIYKELQRSLGIAYPQHGDLTTWAKQGVLLLNTALTVEAGKANSHASWGWNIFTDAVIELINTHLSHCVFLLWGNNAKTKRVLIDKNKHAVFESVHPSPLAGGGFLGNNHFALTNTYLQEHGRIPVQWESIVQDIV